MIKEDPSSDIDFVILWVDGSDPEWIKKKDQWKDTVNPESLRNWNGGDSRYRDWNLLKYWFRGVERFAPWVHKIYFVTDGQRPKWLNTNHSKLICVDHKDFIPNQYLPTFSSHSIELNIHRIEGLSNRFVYFNDDMFLIRPVKKDLFFDRGIPRDSAILKPVRMEQNGIRAEINDLYAINSRFKVKDVIKSSPRKWFNYRYGMRMLSTFMMLPYDTFTGFNILHMPTSFLKTSFENVWNAFPEILDETCSHRFRATTDVNQWLIQYWQYVTGCFIPRSPYIGKTFEGIDQFDEMCNTIRTQKYYMVCCNDSTDIENFEEKRRLVEAAFDSILSGRSQFERSI